MSAKKQCRNYLIWSVVLLMLLITSILAYNSIYSENFVTMYNQNLGVGSLKKIICKYGLRDCTMDRNCIVNDIVWCASNAEGCEDNSKQFCEQEEAVEQHECRNGAVFLCKNSDKDCYDYSPKFCEDERDKQKKDVTRTCRENGKEVSHFHCKEGDIDCKDNSPKYCKKPDKTKEPEKVKHVAQVTKKCKDGTSFNCWKNEPGCFDNSDMYCPGGDSWCSHVGGRGNPICRFDDFDSCVNAGGCVTDPADAHPGWYDISKAKNEYDRMQVVANGGENALTVYDECDYHNTDWNRNPRCKIKKGKYKGKVGVCIFDGVNVQECQPVGQRCDKAVPSYCNEEQELMLGQSREVNPMCVRNSNDEVYLQCV